MEFSAAFATTLETPDHVVIAEDLGFHRAWLYDTPQQSPDVWMCLALAAERTSTIGLGPGVLVPTLRHPMVNAAGAAALEQLAPGRTVVGFGTGYTGRRAMGQSQPIPWSYMTRYIDTFVRLLRGETVEWDGGQMAMLHTVESARLPTDIRVYIAAIGPKGMAVAREFEAGLFTVLDAPASSESFDDVAYMAFGTVIDDGEDITDARVRTAGGPGLMQTLHAAYEFGGEDAITALPGGPEWLATIRQASPQKRHLAVHAGHLLYLNDADVVAWDAGTSSLLMERTLSGSPQQIRDRVDELAAKGVTEVAYQPVGDIARELQAFAGAVGIR